VKYFENDYNPADLIQNVLLKQLIVIQNYSNSGNIDYESEGGGRSTSSVFMCTWKMNGNTMVTVVAIC